MNGEENTQQGENVETPEVQEHSRVSNIAIGVLLVIAAFLAYNFFRGDQPAEIAQVVNDNDVVPSVTQALSENEEEPETELTEETPAPTIIVAEPTEEQVPEPEITLRDETDETPTTGTEQPTTENGKEYTVRPGDTLWEIAANELNDGFLWKEIAQANQIPEAEASHLAIGTNLVLPEVSSAQDTAAVPTDEEQEPATGTETTQSEGTGENQFYVVQTGDNLWKVAEDFYGDGHRWREIFELSENDLSMYQALDGSTYPLLHSGNMLTIPNVPVTQ